MQTPPEISFKGVEMTPQLEKLITNGIAKLEKVCDYIVTTRIAVEMEQGRHQTGNPYRMRIDIGIPDHTIVVKRSSLGWKKAPDGVSGQEARLAMEGQPEPEQEGRLRRSPVADRREEPLPAFITRTFDAAQRELEKVVEKQRREVKAHTEQPPMAIIEKLFREQGYGFLRSVDGQQVYFHRNAVLHSHWDNLTVGTGVRFVPQQGDKGLQASTVEPVSKPGAVEMHGTLHDLPEVVSSK